MADTNDPIATLHWVEIDVAHDWNAVLVETASGQRHRLRMSNSAADMKRLTDFLLGLGGRCRVALELTGDYHRPIAHRLLTDCFALDSRLSRFHR
jgi:transposase